MKKLWFATDCATYLITPIFGLVAYFGHELPSMRILVWSFTLLWKRNFRAQEGDELFIKSRTWVFHYTTAKDWFEKHHAR